MGMRSSRKFRFGQHVAFSFPSGIFLPHNTLKKHTSWKAVGILAGFFFKELPLMWMEFEVRGTKLCFSCCYIIFLGKASFIDGLLCNQ